MQRKVFTTVLLATICLVAVPPARAELKMTGKDATMEADISTFPPNMKSAYALFKTKCAKCHGLDRTLTTVVSGITPSGAVFDTSSVDAYGAKMLRKPDSNMTRQDVKVVLEVLKYMMEEAAK